LTRASIFLAKSLDQADGLHRTSGMPEVRIIVERLQVG
jgi:hypothetical protein